MKKMFTENGLLSEEGSRVFKEILDGKINTILSQAENVAELQILGSLLHKRIGDAVSEKILAQQERQKLFEDMNDEQFKAYLKAKYGDNWIFQTLANEELDRARKLQMDGIEEILKKSAKNITKFPRNGIRFR